MYFKFFCQLCAYFVAYLEPVKTDFYFAMQVNSCAVFEPENVRAPPEVTRHAVSVSLDKIMLWAAKCKVFYKNFMTLI